MNKIKKTIAIVLCLIMAMGSLAFAEEVQLISAHSKDYEGHWAQATIQKWMDAGMVSGYQDGSYKPDNNVTRAEFVKLVNGIIDFNKKGTVSYKDVPSTEWFYDYVSIAQEIGYISGYSATEFGPNDYITREQAASILSRIQYLNSNAAGVDKFNDKNNISTWAKEAVGAASGAGFISGYNDGSLKPLNNLTRAEAITMIDNVLVNSKNIVIYNAGTELKDMVIAGDLIIAKTVGEGDVHLANLSVTGDLKVYGGGMNSIYFNNVNIARIEVEKDKVRLVFDDGTTVEELFVGSETILENTDGTIAKVTITGDNKVTLTGNFDEVTVTGSANITLDDAVIKTLVVEQPITIEGTGTIATLEANADGIKFEAEVKITKTVTGEGVTEAPAVVEAPAAGGGGGGGGIITPSNPKFIVTIDTSESSPLVLNTEDYSSDTILYDAIVGILNDSAYSTDINGFLSKVSTRLGNMQVGDATGTAAIWDKAASFLPGTIDVYGVKTKFVDGTITISDINSLLDVYEASTADELNQIITNLDAANFDETTFKYNGDIVTYNVSETGSGTIPSGNIGIADFILNEVLISNMTLGDFFDIYGTVTFTSTIAGDTPKTATITLQLQ